MCGLTGFLDLSARTPADEARRIVERMAAAIVHRGPDAGGSFVDERAGVALGHRRLSIVDLSEEGRQPMTSADDRWVVAFNGEIYNHRELRAELEADGVSFRGHSDTEVLLAEIVRRGVHAALERFNGMFAFALWDRRERVLWLARDRLGEKPLYYGRFGDTFLFGSELKALREHPAFRAEIDRDVLALLLRHNCVPAPYCILRGVRKLSPGVVARVVAGDVLEEPYWSAEDAVRRAVAAPFRGDTHEAVDELDRRARRAVALRMHADVPLGAFLSSGIDSSTVVALMQAQSSRPVRTFTIGSSIAGYDESADARAIAAHLGTEHTELAVSPDDALRLIPELPALYDEPFADASQIPTHLVAKLARQHVTVALSGDGGDELFGGYNRYVWGERVHRHMRSVPALGRSIASRLLTLLSPAQWDAAAAALAKPIGAFRQRTPGYKLHKLADVLGARSEEELYRKLASHWDEPDRVVLGAREPVTFVAKLSDIAFLPTFAEKMMFVDAVTYLPDDILVKLDRATMGVSLEGRVPFLDHELFEFAWTLPRDVKLRDGVGKWILRQVLAKYVPHGLTDRPKSGFGIPLDAWLRGPLRDWAETLLDERRLAREGYLDPSPIRARFREHLRGARDWQYHLWDVLMFEAWLERFSM